MGGGNSFQEAQARREYGKQRRQNQVYSCVHMYFSDTGSSFGGAEWMHCVPFHPRYYVFTIHCSMQRAEKLEEYRKNEDLRMKKFMQVQCARRYSTLLHWYIKKLHFSTETLSFLILPVCCIVLCDAFTPSSSYLPSILCRIWG